ncbi:hypothetical protein C0580_03060 [Candidatus Parcubacteria bacterium]|nr:MAG: hypothetical protein C0580_03060 [Candidatus Parcubacteria bacterium]
MPSIKITSAPAGQAPLEVRQQWVELILPLDAARIDTRVQVGVLGGAPSLENIDGYPVNAARAVEILAAKSPEAAAWWRTNVPISGSTTFVFGKQFCELVD